MAGWRIVSSNGWQSTATSVDLRLSGSFAALHKLVIVRWFDSRGRRVATSGSRQLSSFGCALSVKLVRCVFVLANENKRGIRAKFSPRRALSQRHNEWLLVQLRNMTTEEKFNAAVNVIRNLPKNGKCRSSSNERPHFRHRITSRKSLLRCSLGQSLEGRRLPPSIYLCTTFTCLSIYGSPCRSLSHSRTRTTDISAVAAVADITRSLSPFVDFFSFSASLLLSRAYQRRRRRCRRRRQQYIIAHWLKSIGWYLSSSSSPVGAPRQRRVSYKREKEEARETFKNHDNKQFRFLFLFMVIRINHWNEFLF